MKITLNILIIGFYIAATVLAFVEKTFWVRSLRWFALVPIIALYLESELLLFQYSYKIPSSFSIHGLVWIALALSVFASNAIYIVMYPEPWEQFGNVSCNLFQTVLFGLRTLTQLLFPQDQVHFSYSFEQRLLQNDKTYSSYFTTKTNTTLTQAGEGEKTHKKKCIFSEISNKRRNTARLSVTITSAKKLEDDYLFQMTVNYKSNTHKVSKTYTEFEELDHILHDHVDHTGKCNDLSSFISENISSINTLMKQLQNYIDNVLKSFDLVPETLKIFFMIFAPEDPLNELEISQEEEEEKIPKKKVRIQTDSRTPRSEGSRTPIQDHSFQEDDHAQAQKAREEHKSIDYCLPSNQQCLPSVKTALLKPDNEFCPYITVKLVEAKVPSGCNYYRYTFCLSLTDDPEENWLITKRYREFKQLCSTLKSKKLKPPKLPPSRIITSTTVLEERKTGLTLFLEIILNEEIFLRCDEVAQFAELNVHIHQLLREKSEKFDFSRWWVRIIGNKVRVLEDGSAITEYIIVVHRETQEESPTSEDLESKGFDDVGHYKLYKRMTEFESLYDALVDRFGKEAIPQLPPKFNAFFSQTSVEFRMKGLEKFLNLLLKIPNIGDCFALRKFLNASTDQIRGHKRRTKRKTSIEEHFDLSKEEEEETFRSSLGSETDKLETIQQLRQKISGSKDLE